MLRLSKLTAVMIATLGVVVSAVMLGTPIEASERFERKIDSGGLSRSFVVFLPDNPKAKSEWKLIIGFHPALATERFMENNAALHQKKGGQNYVVAYPNGWRKNWNSGDCCGEAYEKNVQDVQFVKDMIADIKTMIPLSNKIYVTGFSAGARFVYHLVCTEPQMLAAAAPFGATRDISSGCDNGKVALMHFHGTDDASSPIDGGRAKSAKVAAALGYMESALDVVREQARDNGCSTSFSRVYNPDLDSNCYVFQGCGSRTTEMCPIENLGHVWPGVGRDTRIFGPARRDVDGGQAVINFFNRN